MLGGLAGLPNATRAQIADSLSDMDGWVDSHAWKKELKTAGEGPPDLRELHARVPRHPVIKARGTHSGRAGPFGH
jgi:hypothetical protein